MTRYAASAVETGSTEAMAGRNSFAGNYRKDSPGLAAGVRGA